MASVFLGTATGFQQMVTFRYQTSRREQSLDLVFPSKIAGRVQIQPVSRKRRREHPAFCENLIGIQAQKRSAPHRSESESLSSLNRWPADDSSSSHRRL